MCKRDPLKYGLKLFQRITSTRDHTFIRQLFDSTWEEALMDAVNEAERIRKDDPNSDHPIVKYWRGED
jgi:hypothetical protein